MYYIYIAFIRQQLLVTTLTREMFCGMGDEKGINYDKYVLFVLYM